MIIIEGVDGSGKTTLVNELVFDYGFQVLSKPSDSLRGPTCGIDDWEHQLPDNNRKCIADRHPAISGFIYDQVFDRGFYSLAGLYRLCQELKAGDHYLVVVDPGYTRAKRQAKSQLQMAGVFMNYSKLYFAYRRLCQEFIELNIPYFSHGTVNYTILEDYLESSRPAA